MAEALEAVSTVRRILIADDDPGIVDFLSDRCTKLGFEVQTACNGLQALIMARHTRPDVLIIDVNMPELDGLSTCLRLLDPAKKGFEVIVVTGNSSEETIERCEGFGAIYARKGPDLWNIVRAALVDLFPAMGRVEEAEARTHRAEQRERPLILVIDDDPEVGQFLKARLAKCGVDTMIAPDGIRGYRIAARERPSVIISDYFMPDGDIHYLLWRLRGSPETEKVPIIVMSGRPLDAEAEASLMRKVNGRAGAVRVFQKPFDTNELFLALGQYCALEYEAT